MSKIYENSPNLRFSVLLPTGQTAVLPAGLRRDAELTVPTLCMEHTQVCLVAHL